MESHRFWGPLAMAAVGMLWGAACRGRTTDEPPDSGEDVAVPSVTTTDATSDRTVSDESPDVDESSAEVRTTESAAPDQAILVGPTDAAAGGSAADDAAPEGTREASSVLVRPDGLVYIKPSNTKPGPTSNYSSSFDFSDALALQGDTLVVGAPQESSNASGINGDQSDDSVPSAGAVYVFTRSGSTWSQQAYIKPSNGGSPMNFGWSVALDGETLVVGAREEASASTGVNGNQNDTSVSGDGAVYVFTRSGTTWSQQAYLKPAHTAPNQWCGFAVAVSGDTLAFSCPQDLPTAPDAANEVGSVYILTRTSGVWTQQAYLAPNAYGLGASLALQGDLLAAGVPYQLSPADGSSRTQGGIVEVFSRSGTTWTQEALLSANLGPVGDRGPPSFDDKFGTSLALSNGTLAVTAPEEAYPVDGSPNGWGGATYVFTRSGTAWSGQARLTALDAQLEPAATGGGFANAIALDGDRLVVGAPRACPCVSTDLNELV